MWPFGRKKRQIDSSSANLVPGAKHLTRKQEESAKPGVTIKPDGSIVLAITAVPGAKLAIKELRLAKKSLGVQKKAVTTQMAQMRARRRIEQGKRGPMMRGGGSLGKIVRAGQRAGRDAERKQHAEALAPLERNKAEIDRRMLNIDAAITQLESYIAQSQ
jgi:hypothetical protein